MSTQKAFLLAMFSVGIFSQVICQKDRTNLINSLVAEIEANDVYERTYSVGYSGAVSRQIQMFEELMAKASEAELTEIALNNNNAVVRLYAFQAIKKKAKSISQTLKEKFSSDSSKVITLSGCLGSKQIVKRLAFEPLLKQNEFRSKIAGID